jgi:tetratricopeptide (TPR) repeat protein
MSPVSLPYLERPREEFRLHTFLLDRLEPRPGVSKAILLCGRPGVGKRTLIRHVHAGDSRLRAYRVLHAATRMSTGAPPPRGRREGLAKGADLLGHVLGFSHPLAALVYGTARTLAGDGPFTARSSPPDDLALDYTLLDAITEPTLLVIPGVDPQDRDALHRHASLVREARYRRTPLVIVFLDDVPGLPVAHGEGTALDAAERSPGYAALRWFLEDDRQVEVVPVHPFTPSACRQAFLGLGLTEDWARILYQYSEGGAAGLAALWGLLQTSGLLQPADGGKWKIPHPGRAQSAWELVRGYVTGLLRPRAAGHREHEGRLIRACLLAASMGSSFLPQAVAECVFETDPRRDELDPDAWEDLWHEMLEHADAEHGALAPQAMADGAPRVVRADGRQFFVHAFRDPALVTLLRAAVRQMWRDHEAPSVEGEASDEYLVAASRAMDAWLERFFQEGWREALPFRAALLRARNRHWQAEPLEKLWAGLLQRDTLRAQVERERRRVESGAEPRELFRCLCGYAESLNAAGEIETVLGPLLEAKEIADRAGEAVSREQRLTLMASLGRAMMMQVRHAEAEELLTEVMEAPTAREEPEHTRTLDAANNLALVMRVQARFDEAEVLLRRTVEGYTRMLGSEHPRTLMAVNNLGGVLLALGRVDEAEQIIRRALDARERVLGADHPETLTSLGDIATLLRARGELDEPQRLYQRVLNGMERALGPEHVLTLEAASKAAVGLYELGRLDDAEPLYERLMRAYDRPGGTPHPNMLMVATGYASLLHERGRVDEAESLSRWVLHGMEQVMGPEHPSTMAAVNNLAVLMEATARPDDAESLYRRAIAVNERVLGPDHRDTVRPVFNLAVLLHQHERGAEAEPFYRRALKSYDRVLGPDHPRTVDAVEDLACLLMDEKRWSEAETLLRRLLESSERVHGRSHDQTVLAARMLSTALWEQGRKREFTQLFERYGQAED